MTIIITVMLTLLVLLSWYVFYLGGKIATINEVNSKRDEELEFTKVNKAFYDVMLAEVFDATERDDYEKILVLKEKYWNYKDNIRNHNHYNSNTTNKTNEHN